MIAHLFTSYDGALYDTRAPNWSKAPLRANYRMHHATISTVADFKATLRAGAFAWPGGYQLYLLVNDGAALCFDCGRKEARQVMNSIATRANDGWRCVACSVNYEDTELWCAHCNEQIPAAYSD